MALNAAPDLRQINISDLLQTNAVIPYDQNEIEEVMKKLMYEHGITDILYPGSNISQLTTVISYVISSLNINTAINIQETILPLATKRMNVLFGARQLGYEATPKKAYKYTMDVTQLINPDWKTINSVGDTVVDVEQTSPNFIDLKQNSIFSSGSKTYYYKGPTITNFFGFSNYQITHQDDTVPPDGFVKADFYKNIEVVEGTLISYEDDPTLEFTVKRYQDENFEPYTKQDYLIPHENVEEDGIQIWVNREDYDSPPINGQYAFQIIEKKPSKHFLIDETFTADKDTFVRLQNIILQYPTIFFQYAGMGTPVEPNDTVLVNVFTTLGADGKSSIEFEVQDTTLSQRIDIIQDTVKVSQIGQDVETIRSIKEKSAVFNNTANRAVTKYDYITIVGRHPDVDRGVAWGGEEEETPQLGHVYVSTVPRYPREYTYDENFTTLSTNAFMVYKNGLLLDQSKYRYNITQTNNNLNALITFTNPLVTGDWVRIVELEKARIIKCQKYVGSDILLEATASEIFVNGSKLYGDDWNPGDVLGIEPTMPPLVVNDVVCVDTPDVLYNNTDYIAAGGTPETFNPPAGSLYVDVYLNGLLLDEYSYDWNGTDVEIPTTAGDTVNIFKRLFDGYTDYTITTTKTELTYQTNAPINPSVTCKTYDLEIGSTLTGTLEPTDGRDQWYQNDSAINDPDNGILAYLDYYKIITLQMHHQQPLYVDFILGIDVIKYDMTKSKDRVNEIIFETLQDYFEDQLEIFDAEYVNSNLQRVLDSVLTFQSGLGFTTQIQGVLERNMIETDKILFSLAFPFEDMFVGNTNYPNGGLNPVLLPSIDTVNFGVNYSTLTVDYADIVNWPVDTNEYTLDVFLDGANFGSYTINRELSRIDVILDTDVATWNSLFFDPIGGADGTGEDVYVKFDIKYPFSDDAGYNNNVPFTKTSIPRLRRVQFKDN